MNIPTSAVAEPAAASSLPVAMPLQVAPTRLADTASLRACIDLVARETHFLASCEAPTEEELARELQESARSNSIHLVAKDAQRVVGWVHIDRGRGDAVAHRGDLGMGVLPDYRGCGIGRRLLDDCISVAHILGIQRVELEVRSDNRRALTLYRNAGFAVEAIVKGAMKINDVYHDAFRMCLVTAQQRPGAMDAASTDKGSPRLAPASGTPLASTGRAGQ